MNSFEYRSRPVGLRSCVGCLAILLAIPLSAQAQVSFDRLVVFGTSLSDPGNAFALRGGTNTPPDYSVDPLLVPAEPYTRGGHHFSDGPTWIEQFARSLGLASNANPAYLSSNPRATNYAVGAARAREDNVNVNLPAQVSAFLQQTGGSAPSGALYVIEMGSNDVRDALVQANPGLLQLALASIGSNVAALYQAGARKFLIWNVPNIALTPAIRSLNNPAATTAATQLSLGFNQGLNVVLGQLTALPGIEIVTIDVHLLLNTVVANPSNYGFSNVTTACISPSEPPFHCQDAGEFLFWDGIHPTKAMHGIIAQEAALKLALAP